MITRQPAPRARRLAALLAALALGISTLAGCSGQAEEELAAKGVTPPEDLFFMKQNVSNACGTIALVHAVVNSGIGFAPDGILQNLLKDCEGKSIEEKGNVLASLGSLVSAHQEVASAGLTTVDMNVMNHFIALVEHKGTLYELDGRKSVPVPHGPVEPDGFMTAAARVCKEFMARDPDEVNFNIMALTGV